MAWKKSLSVTERGKSWQSIQDLIVNE